MNMDSDKLLLIESNDATRRLIEQHFVHAGYRVLACDSASETPEVFDSFQPDIVICHTDVDGGQGVAVLRTLLHEQPDVPVIAISDVRVKADVLQAIEMGASDYVADPVANLEILAYLAHRFIGAARLAQDNARYRQELEEMNDELTASLELLREDQEAGRSVQQKMLPESPLHTDGLTFSYRLQPSLYMSGDFVDYFPLGHGRVLFYIADVSGHGASSAFVTVLLKQLIGRIPFDKAEVVSPADALAYLNRELLDSGVGKHLTVFMGIIDLARETLTYSLGAHFPLPILATETQAQYLEGRGMPVGLFPEARYEDCQVELPPAFDLLLVSDGVLEILPQSRLADKEQYLLETVAQRARTVEALAQALEVDARPDAPDDIALMIVSRATAYANR